MYTTTIFLYIHIDVYICSYADFTVTILLKCRHLLISATCAPFLNFLRVCTHSKWPYVWASELASERSTNACVRVHSNWLPWLFWWCTNTCVRVCVLGPVHVSVWVMCACMCTNISICDCEREKECLYDVCVCVRACMWLRLCTNSVQITLSNWIKYERHEWWVRI